MGLSERQLEIRGQYKDFKHKGKQIIDEKCSCKHLKSEHEDAVGGLAIGHGKCAYPTCGCQKFRWVSWVTAK